MQHVQIPVGGLPLTLIVNEALEMCLVLMDATTQIIDAPEHGLYVAYIFPDMFEIEVCGEVFSYSYSTLYDVLGDSPEDETLLDWLRCQNLINPF